MGITLNEFLEYQSCATELSEAGGRALGGIISKFKTFKNIGFETFLKLYHTGVVPIIEYASGIWGFQNFKQVRTSKTGQFVIFLVLTTKHQLNSYMEKLAGLDQSTEYI